MKKFIVMIDDSELMLAMVSEVLTEAGYEVATSVNCIEANAHIFGKQKPDLILMDIQMPEMDGFEVITQIKNDPELKSTPILIMSNLGEEDHIQKGLQLGAMGYIVKSDITPSQIIEKLKSVLNGTYKA